MVKLIVDEPVVRQCVSVFAGVYTRNDILSNITILSDTSFLGYYTWDSSVMNISIFKTDIIPNIKFIWLFENRVSYNY